jgi:hypothetical protein
MMARQLMKYDAARRAVAEAHRIDEVKNIRDKAVAMSVYAKQAKDGELIAQATAVRKRAERRLGELIEADRKAGKLAKPPGGSNKRPRKDRVVKKPDLKTLADQGIDKNLADRARKAAAMSAAKFEQQVARAVKVAVAATEGDAAVVREARQAQLEAKRNRRVEREREFAVCDHEWDFEPWSRETGMDRHAANHYETASDSHTAAELHERTRTDSNARPTTAHCGCGRRCRIRPSRSNSCGFGASPTNRRSRGTRKSPAPVISS